ncbi:protein-export membrane protein SecF [Candidatus Endolissoclinum faulkneri L5]|uniref:Protein-export membrane protein SecF n=1 Tax=Candidatus Endolissoclinum faulkneri L5 TaxID=1401328 RepID=V9TQX9_9PROT|nr:protein translocase subunit SecF [Candidatus Endolissoclinum faulkneri]AHC73284.1 protein-export membrane protein SecF [Candidatus Endolissoclinum faulkneri L5]
MKLLRIVPSNSNIPFIKYHLVTFLLSAMMLIGSIFAIFSIGLSFGIDFKGGLVVEVEINDSTDIAQLRSDLNKLGLGGVILQEFSAERAILIRVPYQGSDKNEQTNTIKKIRQVMPSNIKFRRTEFVGPTVGREMINAAVLAIVLALLSIMIYIWFCFEWQFGLCAILALVHDIILTIGLFSLIEHEFNTSTVAALLAIAGSSINDTVVIYDRVRENLQLYKNMSLSKLLELSINETLSRTTTTSFTTLLALASVYFFGGAGLTDFALAMIWGISVGTYSSIFIAAPLLLYTGVCDKRIASS